jgi:hypothetical protein
MGVVYEVFDQEQQRHLALKTLSTAAYGGAAILRFKREFRLLQDIQHEHLVELGELIEEGGRPSWPRAPPG